MTADTADKIRIDPALAAQLGLPELVEPWHFNLIYASVNPAAYADTMADLDERTLFDCYASWELILGEAAHDIRRFVHEDLRTEFVKMVGQAQAIVAAELIARGFDLPQTQQQVH